jgi:hypothetical protein
MPPELSVMIRVSLNIPAAMGAKRNPMEQLEPALTVNVPLLLGEQLPPLRENGTARLLPPNGLFTVRFEVPVLASVIVIALFDPIAVSGNISVLVIARLLNNNTALGPAMRAAVFEKSELAVTLA